MKPEPIQSGAFCLFEKGRYEECLGSIRAIPPAMRDTQFRILEALCLVEISRWDDAEVCLRDLRMSVPDSAEICIYLGRILRERGDDEARAAFSEAVRLDPDNRDGLSWYADLLISQKDFAAAIPVLVRLLTLSDDPLVLKRLMHAYRMNRQPEDAIIACESNGCPVCTRSEYLAALSDDGRSDEIVSRVDTRSNPPDEEMICLLYALADLSPDTIDEVLLPRLREGCGSALVAAYVRILLKRGRFWEAAGVWSTYLSDEKDPGVRILICPALTALGELEQAEGIYHSILFPDPPDAPMEDIREWLFEYYSLLRNRCDSSVAGFIEQAGSMMHPSYAACAGSVLEEEGSHTTARMLYQKAFRSDLVHGGLLYAAYLKRTGDLRELEKIITYILKNTCKISDIELIITAVFPDIRTNIGILRTVHAKLAPLLPLLTSEGKILYCQAAGLLASEELLTGRYSEGLTLCLDALAEVPPHAVREAEHLFSVLMACKTPGLPVRYHRPGQRNLGKMTLQGPVISGLTPAEDAALSYLRRHRVCSELELRQVCGTMRVAGLMNRLIRKISTEGWQIVVKEGISESGEVYRYAGP